MQAVKAVNNLKKSVINTLFVLIAGITIGVGGTVWIVQQNLDGVCSLVTARNQFIDVINKDRK